MKEKVVNNQNRDQDQEVDQSMRKIIRHNLRNELNWINLIDY